MIKVHTQMHKYKRELKKKSEFFLVNRVFKQWRKGEASERIELRSETSYTGTENQHLVEQFVQKVKAEQKVKRQTQRAFG